MAHTTQRQETSMPTSIASATWEGGLKGGRGHFKAGSGAFEGDYSFPTRFEGARGTNPEELIAAAHAACLSMALSAGLEKAGTPATRISTKASCTIDQVGDGFKITRMRLEVRGKVAGLDQSAFGKAAESAKKGCPVSGALQGNVQIDLDARLE
jgi:osmotically inducible protein OsmC